MPVVGTAGHVDHGKSTLVRALTGRDPDRWEEEKRRGLTIDLGFAWTAIDGLEMGFVDVPGHERFIKNMLAGVDAVDVALFVVAADEGWMPQSEEHLAVLDLLGISSAVVAITRADLVDEDGLELAMLTVADQLEGTSLEASPMVAVAAPEGRGVDELRTALAAALGAVPRADGDRARLWVDRAFTIGGAGTVVTGTLVDGPLQVGDTVDLWPGPQSARVRGLQSHEQAVERVDPGSRTAVNLVGVEVGEVARGAMLGRAGDWVPSDHLLAEVRTVRSLGDPITDRGAFHLHVGSGAWRTRVRLLESAELGAGATGAVLLQPEEPLPLKMGDRLILREVGRRAVVAGGVVLDPAPGNRTSRVVSTLPALRPLPASADERATALLEIRNRERVATIAAHSGGGVPSGGTVAGDLALADAEVERLVELTTSTIAQFHEDNPLRPGMQKAASAAVVGVTVDALDVVVASTDRVVDDGPTVRLATFEASLDAALEESFAPVADRLRADGVAAPRTKELGLGQEVYHALRRHGRLVEVADFSYLPETLEELAERVREMNDGFTVADFRDSLGITRKHAVPLLEWLDRTGVTVRDGDARRVRR